MTISERKTIVCELTRDEFNESSAFEDRSYEDLKPYVMVVIGGETTDYWLGLNRYGVLYYDHGECEKQTEAQIIADVQRLTDADYWAWELLLEDYDNAE